MFTKKPGGFPQPQFIESGFLIDIQETELRPDLDLTDPDVIGVITDLRNFAGSLLTLLTLLRTDNCQVSPRPYCGSQLDTIIANLGDPATDPIIEIEKITSVFSAAQQGLLLLSANRNDLRPNTVLPPQPLSLTSFLSILQQELCIQADMEERWRNLVKSMAPNCFGIDAVLDSLEQVIEGARGLVSGEVCPIFQPSIPPHYETALDAIANDVDSLGGGR